MSKVTSEKKNAVIGMECRFPGGASSPEKYWDPLQNGRDAIIDVSEDRWDVKKYYDPNPGKPGKAYVMRGGFLKVRVAHHSYQMEPLASEFACCLRDLRAGTTALPLYSTVTGEGVEPGEQA
jgi:acyl transferase domain-containing protein